MRKKLTMVLSLIIIISLLLTGCGGKGGDSKTSGGEVSGTTAKKDTLNYGIGAEPTSLDPSISNDLVSYSVVHQLYDYLIVYRPDGTITPGLAESWELS